MAPTRLRAQCLEKSTGVIALTLIIFHTFIEQNRVSITILQRLSVICLKSLYQDVGIIHSNWLWIYLHYFHPLVFARNDSQLSPYISNHVKFSTYVFKIFLEYFLPRHLYNKFVLFGFAARNNFISCILPSPKFLKSNHKTYLLIVPNFNYKRIIIISRSLCAIYCLAKNFCLIIYFRIG